tara:strand:+ start:257 stop:1276 length:1020 start_codon:yes stop_codon:yes gene_type:complete
MNKMKAIVIGLGQSGLLLDLDKKRELIWSHAYAIHKHPKLELSAAVDLDPRKEKFLKKKIQTTKKVPFFTNLEKALKEIQPEFVSICTPNKFHLKNLKVILKNKNTKFIFCEKPLGKNYKEAKEMVDLSEKNKIVLATNYMRRWDKRYLWIKDKINSNHLGKLISINANGATAMYTSASHLIDMLCYLGGEIERVSGFLQKDFIREVHGQKDRGANAFLKFKSGVTCHLKASSKSPRHYLFEIDLFFEEGKICIKSDGNYLGISNFKNNGQSGTGYLSLSEKEIFIKSNERMIDALSNIISSNYGNNSPNSSGKNALQVHKIIEGIKNSSKKNGNFFKI